MSPLDAALSELEDDYRITDKYDPRILALAQALSAAGILDDECRAALVAVSAKSVPPVPPAPLVRGPNLDGKPCIKCGEIARWIDSEWIDGITEACRICGHHQGEPV